MALPVSGTVGPTASNAQDGAATELRLGHTGDLIVSQNMPRYAELMARGLVFSAANQAAQAVSVALATTYTGLLLFNPVQSGKILIPLKWKFSLSVAPAAIATLVLLGGFAATGGVTAKTTPLSVQSTQVGNGNTGAGVALSAATIVAPTWLQQLQDGFTAAALPNPTLLTDLEGCWGILPGGFMGIGALTAVTGLGSVVWAELAYNPQG